MQLTFKRHTVLPGFGLTLGFTLSYLSLIVLIPLAALFLKSAGTDTGKLWAALTDARVMEIGRASCRERV